MRRSAHSYTDCPEAPGSKVATRSKRDYRIAWVAAVQHDLDCQRDLWEELAAIAPGPTITPLPALDIIGWELGKRRGKQKVKRAD